MKKTLLTLALLTATVAAFAQGKVSFQTDTAHLAFYSGTTAQDSALQGTGINSGAMPAGVTLIADLYMGSSSSSLSLYNTTSFSAVPGKWNSANVLLSSPILLAGVAAFTEVVIADQAATQPATIVPGDATGLLTPWGTTYFGHSVLFTFKPGSSAYTALYNAAAGPWPTGTTDLSGLYGAGAAGAVPVAPIPEPATLALAGLGAAALMIFRRRQ